jgi:hypothetical protein
VADDLFPIPFIDKMLPNRPELWALLTIVSAWIIIYHVVAIKKFEREDL